MNSCRNCQHAKHDGAIIPALYCVQTKRTVAPPVSKNTEDNITTDAKLRTLAATCGEYKREE